MPTSRDVLPVGTKDCPPIESTAHACYELTDKRTCYELRYYGRSPIPRTDWDHSEAEYFQKDDGECACECHIDEEYDVEPSVGCMIGDADLS